MYVSVDLGGTTIACALASNEGRIVAEKSVATQSNEGPQTVLRRIGRLVLELASEAHETPAAMGMGVPGLLDNERARTRFLPNFPTQWRDIPVAETLSQQIDCPVFLLNDSRLATLGELVFGHGGSVRDMLLFTLGTGIGGGVVIDGKLRLGPVGAAGELGHQTIVVDGPLCGCGNRGCLETLASGPAISAEGVRLMKSGLAPKLFEIVGGDAAAIGPKEMALAAEGGEATVRDAIVRAARYLGIGAANLVTALHPELVVLGGGVAAIGDLLLNTVRDEISQRVRMFPPDDVRVERSLLGDKAGIWGGIALAMRGGAV
jgi:glucokinase